MLLAWVSLIAFHADASFFDTRTYRRSVTCASLIRSVQPARPVSIDGMAQELREAGFGLGAHYLLQSRQVVYNPMLMKGSAAIEDFVADVRRWETYYKQHGFDPDLTVGGDLALVWAVGLAVTKLVSPLSIANELGQLIKYFSGNGRIRAETLDFSLWRFYGRAKKFLADPTARKSLRIEVSIPDSIFQTVVRGDPDHLEQMREFNGFEVAPWIFKLLHQADMKDLMARRGLTPTQTKQLNAYFEPKPLEFDFWFYKDRDGVPSLSVVTFRPERVEAINESEKKLHLFRVRRLHE